MGEKAAYINTGTWSDKAIKEAQRLGDVIEVASSKEKKLFLHSIWLWHSPMMQNTYTTHQITPFWHTI